MAVADEFLERSIRDWNLQLVGSEPKLKIVLDAEDSEFPVLAYVRCTQACQKYRPKDENYLILKPGMMLNVIACEYDEIIEFGGDPTEGEWFGECEGQFGLFPVYLTEMIYVKPP